MAEKQIASAFGAFQTVTDFRTGKNADGSLLDLYNEPFEIRANVALALGDLVTFVVPTSTVPVSVTNAVATGGAGTFLGGFRVAGVVLKATALGGAAQVNKYGFCLVNVGAGTPVIGDMGVPGASAGQVDVIAAATGIAAGTFVANVIGIFLGTKDASNLAAFWYDHR